ARPLRPATAPMMAQLLLSFLLSAILAYALAERRRSPVVGVLALAAASAGLYFVWVPAHATALAEFAGIGPGGDLILYTWVVSSVLVLLTFTLKFATKPEAMTGFARAFALGEALRAAPQGTRGDGAQDTPADAAEPLFPSRSRQDATRTSPHKVRIAPSTK